MTDDAPDSALGLTPEARPQRIVLTDRDAAVLSDIASFDDAQIMVQGQSYILDRRVGRGFKGVVWKVHDQYETPFALKLTIAEDYAGTSIHRELHLRAQLPSPIFTRCVSTDVWETEAIPERRFIVTVEDWVDGVTLEEFLETKTDELTTETLLHFGQGMCAALLALQTKNLVHDDLHARNVMLRRLAPGEGMQYGVYASQVWTVVVVDTGSLKRATNARKDRDDIAWVAEHLVSLHNHLRRRPNLTQTQLRYLRSVLEVVESMLDPEPARAMRAATDLHTQLETAYSQALTPPARESQLRHPFDFLSAERIADDDLFIRLYTEVPWMSQVAGPDPILLTGPRGCGKSMLFRWLALRTHLGRREEIPEGTADITGIYVSCTTELQNRFLGLNTEVLAKTHTVDIVHYFNLLLARELLITIDHVRRHAVLRDVYGIGPAEQRAVMEFVLEQIGSTSANIFGTAPLRIAIVSIEREMFHAHRRLLRGEQPATATSTSFLGELTAKLVDTIQGLSNRPIVFLLDDFSTHRVPEHVQRVLGPIVWERRPSHVFKISSEKNGVIFDYQDGATADVSRERFEIDCGKEYIDLSTRNPAAKQIERFARDLLARRLELAGWAGTPEQLIGDSPPYPEWIRALRDGSKPPMYYGLRTISELCSGDIATLLMIYGKILANCSRTQTQLVTQSGQNTAILEVSTAVLMNLVPQRPHGQKMFSLAQAFAHFAGQAVIRGKLVDGDPRECPRIEVDQGAENKTDLDPELRELLDELIRRSVFIELEPSRSRREQVSTLRLHIRRIYMPAFRGPLRKNVALKPTPSKFEWFLNEPQAYLDTALAAIEDPKKRRKHRGDVGFDFSDGDD